MHMILRHIIWFLKRFSLSKAKLNETTTIEMRVLPTDLDFMWHVNNGVYFSFLDFGRMNMIFRNGIFELTQREGWYAVVGAETMKFRRSLQLWDKFKIETRTIGYDDKYFFIQQKIIHKDNIAALGIIKVRFLSKKGGGVNPAFMIEKMGAEFKNEVPKLGEFWAELESTYLK